jgi:hypothetical protein
MLEFFVGENCHRLFDTTDGLCFILFPFEAVWVETTVTKFIILFNGKPFTRGNSLIYFVIRFRSDERCPARIRMRKK